MKFIFSYFYLALHILFRSSGIFRRFYKAEIITAKIQNEVIPESMKGESDGSEVKPNEFISNVIVSIQNFSNLPSSYKKWLNEYFRNKINAYLSTIRLEFKIDKLSKNVQSSTFENFKKIKKISFDKILTRKGIATK